MEITDIRIRKTFETGPLKAILSVTLENELAIHDVKLISVRGRTFAVMPSKRMNDGTFRDVVHPTNSALRTALEEAVVKAYEASVGTIRTQAEPV